MNTLFSSLHFVALSYLWFVPLFVLMGAMVIYRSARTIRIIELLAAGRVAFLLPNFSRIRLSAKVLCMLCALASMCIALLRPVYNKQMRSYAQEGRDLFIALDVSRSMLAVDGNPDRLTVAKEKIKELLRLLKDTQVGLILFSGSAFVQCPLTFDYAAFCIFLDSVDVETIATGTTSLGAALDTAITTFEKMPNKKNKIVVLFTDGEDFSENSHAIQSRAREVGLSIFAVGVGTTQGAPIPLYDTRGMMQGHQKDEQGKVVISRLNETLLASLARDFGGSYIRAADTSADMRSIVDQITRFEKEKYEHREVVTGHELYPYLLVVSFIALVCEWLL